VKDLFGFDHPDEDPDEYQAYINSPRWKRLRAQKLEETRYQCEGCQLSRLSVTLEVHHLTYERLGAERLEDLQVLCEKCHAAADEQRKKDMQTQRAEKKRSAIYRGFETWFANGNTNNANIAKRKFLTMLYNNTGISYKLDLNLLGYDDDDPEWRPE